MKKTALFGAVIAVTLAGAAWASWHDRVPVEFYAGHTHVDGTTHGAPSHSGGTNRYGCHNGSVPYHCH